MTTLTTEPRTRSTEGHTMNTTPISRHSALAPSRSEAQPVPFTRVLAVELRKAVSTTSQRILLLAVVAAAVIGAVCTTIFWDPLAQYDYPWMAWQGLIIMLPAVLVLPVVILLATSEWSTRSAMTTFTLEPRRSRVIAAKLLTAVLIIIGVWLLCTGLGAASYAVGAIINDAPMDWSGVSWMMLLGDLGGFLLVSLSAVALGLLLHNSAAAILVVLAAPPMTQAAMALHPALLDALPWVFLNDAVNVLRMAEEGSAADWGRLATSVTVWVIIPLVLGWIRTSRREAS